MAAADHEIHLLPSVTPIEQLAFSCRRRIGQMRAHRGLDQSPAELTVGTHPAGLRPAVTVISAVFITCSFGLEPRLRATSPAYFRQAADHAGAGEQVE